MTFCCYRLLDASSDRSALGDRSSSLLSDLPADEPCLLYVHMTVLSVIGFARSPEYSGHRIHMLSGPRYSHADKSLTENRTTKLDRRLSMKIRFSSHACGHWIYSVVLTARIIRGFWRESAAACSSSLLIHRFSSFVTQSAAGCAWPCAGC